MLLWRAACADGPGLFSQQRYGTNDGSAELPIAAFARFDKSAEVMLHLGGATRYPDERQRTLVAAGAMPFLPINGLRTAC